MQRAVQVCLACVTLAVNMTSGSPYSRSSPTPYDEALDDRQPNSWMNWFGTLPPDAQADAGRSGRQAVNQAGSNTSKTPAEKRRRPPKLPRLQSGFQGYDHQAEQSKEYEAMQRASPEVGGGGSEGGGAIVAASSASGAGFENKYGDPSSSGDEKVPDGFRRSWEWSRRMAGQLAIKKAWGQSDEVKFRALAKVPGGF